MTPASSAPAHGAGGWADGPLTPLSWSEPILAALVAALRPETLADAFGVASDEAGACEELRAQVAESARDDPELRAWLWSSWRRERHELVETLARRLAGRHPTELSALLRRHGAATLSLAVLSEPGEDPEELVEEALAHLSDAGARRSLRVAFERWLAPPPPEASIAARLIVIGGHPRERARLEALLGPHAGGLKWIPAVKGTGRGEAQLALSAVSRADTVVIVTGRVSHTIMQSARKVADAQGADCHFVEQLTERQVERLLEEIRRRNGT